MGLNKKGVSMVALVITIILIILIASIALTKGYQNLAKAQQAAFISDLDNAIQSLNVYHERAAQFGVREYKKYYLMWDGESPYMDNSGKLNYLTNDVEGKKIDAKHAKGDDVTKIELAPDDSPEFLFNGQIPNTLSGKIEIYEGDLYVKPEFEDEFEIAVEKYEYMSNAPANWDDLYDGDPINYFNPDSLMLK